ncbi:MAG: small multi-drug export protein [Spirochaetales bacterium]|jgi:uncharacterized membrane protein|nr:small multi-drug export protein [Spirochaetales bacterium]
MNIQTLGVTLLLSLLPISELRGAIPYALSRGWPPALAFGLSVLGNLLVAPLFLLFLNSLHRWLYRRPWYAGIFTRLVELSRKKIEGPVNRYGYWGLLIFVAIPLPVTGAWTGVLGGWILGIKPRRVILGVSCGVVIAGILVLGAALALSPAFSFMLKRF